MDKKFAALLGIFFILFSLFIALIVFEQPLTRLIRASVFIPSTKESLIFAWPLRAPADGKTNIVISIFVRDEDGNNVKNKNIKVVLTKPLIGQLDKTEGYTDENGKVEFNLKSDKTGIAVIKAMVNTTDGLKEIEKTLFVAFTPVE